MGALFTMFVCIGIGIYFIAASLFLADAPWPLLSVVGTILIIAGGCICNDMTEAPNRIRCEMLKGQFLEGECYKATKIKLPEEGK